MSKAYTLIEILIVIGVIAILTGLSSLSIVSFSKSGDIDASRAIAASALKEARANSMAVIDDKAWGVYLENERVIIFGSNSGEGYNPQDPANSARVIASHTNLAWNLTAGGQIIEFAKRTGKTINEGIITITGSGQATKTITVNSEGMIE